MFSLSFFSAIKQSHLRKVLFAFFPPSLWAGRVEAHDRTKIVLSRVGGSSRYLLFSNFLSFSHRPILVPMLRIYCICSIFCARTSEPSLLLIVVTGAFSPGEIRGCIREYTALCARTAFRKLAVHCTFLSLSPRVY